jgi:hypothetical protein
MKKVIASVVLLVALVATGIASAASEHSSGSGGTITYTSEEDAKNPNSGIPSFVVSPGQSLKFHVGRKGDPGTYDEISVSDTPNFGKTFHETIYAFTWVWKRVQYGDYKWTWAHYARWGGQNSCSIGRYANDQWSNGQGVFWHYQGAGSYILNVIDACVWYAGRQGHYAYCPISFGCIQDDWPWNTNRYLGWGAVQLYGYGR